MPITLSEALQFTLKWEGGYTNHPKDPGGATNFGIIQVRYDEYRKFKGLRLNPVKNITVAEYIEIYDKYYWDPVRAQYVDGTLGLVLFDTAVNMGVGGCLSRLQAVLKVPITGTFTKAISDKIHDADQTDVALKVCQLRIKKRYDRVKQRPDQKVFLDGWLNRDRDLINKVKSMAGISAMSIEEEAEPDVTDFVTEEDLKLIDGFDED